MKEKWVCKRCGKEITEKPYKNQCCQCKGRFIHYRKCDCGQWFLDARYDKKYCSEYCRNNLITSKKHKPVKLICKQCGNEFTRYLANVKKTKYTFCSKECLRKFNKSKKQIRKCLNCNKEFEINNSILSGKTNASGNYCCSQCYYDSMRFLENPHRYGKEFKQNKKKYFKNSYCLICGTNKNIHIHHVIPFRLTQDNSIQNLVPLCSSHHKIFENLSRPLFENAENYDMIRYVLKNILSERYFATKTIIKELKNARKKIKS